MPECQNAISREADEASNVSHPASGKGSKLADVLFLF